MDKIRICSWDVGILNLAYCIIEKDLKTNLCTIIDWNIINLTDDKKSCTNKVKNGNICGKKASLYYTENNDTTYYCNIHAKLHQPLPKNWETIFMKLYDCKIKKQCMYDSTCNANSKYESENKYYCKKHSDIILKKIKKSKELIKIKKINATNINLQRLSENICKKIDLVNGIYNVNDVLIEHQPVLKNPTIKSIGCFIFHHFVVRCMENSNVKFISASNKLKIDDIILNHIINNLLDDDKLITLIVKTIKIKMTDINEDSIHKIINKIINIDNYKEFIKYIISNTLSKKKNKNDTTDSNILSKLLIPINDFLLLTTFIKEKIGYTINKLLSIKYTNYLLTTNSTDIEQKWLSFLNTHSKKDDLCDAYLQGYYYIQTYK
jgi:hypothetical protein